ncbi:probable ribonuclease 11 [Lepus europaeus]|uniref:probable ribonuclease 11 n=1 Tax=Lepus europaeus TaxID=9983 RepID=UPI002B46EF53|nr:probable ribonuclease 11 [Lepus europaeus]
MENSLLLLSLGLVLTGASESTVEVTKEEFAAKKVQHALAKSGRETQTDEALMNLTLLDKNTSPSLSKDMMSSSLLTFRKLQYRVSKGNSPSSDRECCNEVTIWRKASEANGSCKLSNDLTCGTVEGIRGVQKMPSCECGENPGVSCCQSAELENTVCQLPTGRQLPRCRYHSVTSLKKLLTVLTGHSLMSWLVSGSKL